MPTHTFKETLDLLMKDEIQVYGLSAEFAVPVLTESCRSVLAPPEAMDVSTLDQNHVIPNMGLVVVRGARFPHS
jgi:hypothetical protein